MSKPARDLYLIILCAVLLNSVLWLDSFERYLNGRYHIYLSQCLPDAAFLPSRVVREAIAPEDSVEQPLAVIPIARADRIEAPAAVVPPPQAEPLPASAVAVPPLALPESGVPQAPEQPVEVALQPASAPAVAQQIAAAEESEPKVLFAGDSMMQGVAPKVISRLRKDFPNGVYVDLSKPSTGLTAKRYFDWPARIKEESLRNGIQVIVVFLGPNDPWDIYEGRKRYAFPSASWEEKYRSRVDEVLDFAVANGMRVIWIGLPAMREERIAQGAKIENRIFRDEMEKYRFEYLPTEDFLGSLDDPYTKYIDDPQKGKLAVRLDDGVHFTSLGLRMISSRVDELLRKRDKS